MLGFKQAFTIFIYLLCLSVWGGKAYIQYIFFAQRFHVLNAENVLKGRQQYLRETGRYNVLWAATFECGSKINMKHERLSSARQKNVFAMVNVIDREIRSAKRALVTRQLYLGISLPAYKSRAVSLSHLEFSLLQVKSTRTRWSQVWASITGQVKGPLTEEQVS